MAEAAPKAVPSDHMSAYLQTPKSTACTEARDGVPPCRDGGQQWCVHEAAIERGLRQGREQTN